MTSRLLLALFAILSITSFAACDSSSDGENALCTFEGSVSCYCETGGIGQQSCSADGVLLACDCSCEAGEKIPCVCDGDQIRTRTCNAEGYFDDCDCSDPPENISYSIESGTFTIPMGYYSGTVGGEAMEVWLDENHTISGRFVAWGSGGATLYVPCTQ